MKDFHWKIMGRLGNNLFQWAYLYSQVRQGKLPDIYLQDYKYFHQYRGEIVSILSEGIGEIDRVAIHVRRGDYVGNPFYVDLFTTNYYERAMGMFPKHLFKFLVFSDDIEWCKQQEIFKDCEFSEGKTAEEDFNLMASCRGMIMSNSSLSWWAAYVNPRVYACDNRTLGDGVETVLVFYPDKWFTDGVKRITFPDTWYSMLERPLRHEKSN